LAHKSKSRRKQKIRFGENNNSTTSKASCESDLFYDEAVKPVLRMQKVFFSIAKLLSVFVRAQNVSLILFC
jgi:hypothetical protein